MQKTIKNSRWKFQIKTHTAKQIVLNQSIESLAKMGNFMLMSTGNVENVIMKIWQAL